MRRRSKPHTFAERLAAEKVRLEQEAAKLTAGRELEGILSKIRQIDVASDIHEWLEASA
ncbi:hypothetical protein AB7008_37140 [Bradyrhizobium sp. 521_C7_N1_3]|uniref:hypothetical protein n=1 Tax=Bradyrhizobium TaxID=374 RepID=UPI002227B8DC|nr:hypothetical protein [Bradyrhizobium japonicum]MBR0916578.1 hypothetical protein [Bradyrhizobium japonicum]MCW2220771.1 hypothetical protein [Bradyrhizobium japonicum]MCW2345385.1 hypothetical protein [Bradyrhizobium japonicum]